MNICHCERFFGLSNGLQCVGLDLALKNKYTSTEKGLPPGMHVFRTLPSHPLKPFEAGLLQGVASIPPHG